MRGHEPDLDGKLDRPGAAGTRERPRTPLSFSGERTASITLVLPLLRGAVQGALGLLVLAAAFLLIQRFATVLLALFAGLTISVALKPAVLWLHRRGVPRWAAALAVYLALATLAVGVLLLAVPVLAQQIGTVATSAPAQLERLRHALRGSSSRALRDAAAHVPNLPAAGLLDAPWGVLRTEDLLARVRAAGHAVTAVAATMLLAFFWTVEGERRVRALALLAPLDRRREIHAFAREAERKVGAYVRGQAVVCLVIGAMAWAAYARLGLPCAFILGLAYAAGEAVPVLGPLVGTMLAVAVALSVDPSLALWVVAVAAGLQLTENYLLVPRVMKRAVGVNPLVTLLAVSGFGSVFGVAGAVLAIPMAAVAQLSIDRMLGLGRAPGRGAGADGQPPPGRDRASLLRYQVREIGADVRKLLRLPDGEAPARVRGRLHAERLEDAVESLAADLDRILARQQRGPSP